MLDAFWWNFGHGDRANTLFTVIVNRAVAVPPRGSVAVMVASDWAATVVVVMENVAVVAPDGTVIVPGTAAAARLLAKRI